MRSFRRVFHGASSERVYQPCGNYHGFTGGGLGLTVLTGDRTSSAPSRAPVLEPGLTVDRGRAAQGSPTSRHWHHTARSSG